MRQDLNVTLNQQTAWLGVSRQSSAAKGNMGARPPMIMSASKPMPDG